MPIAGLSNPVVLGVLLGCLYSVAPDHLGSLLAMVAGLQKAEHAFMVGVYWGLGHSAGMILIFLVLLGLTRFVTVDAWEHYGNYFAGVLMVCVGLHFLRAEEQFIEQRSDGTFVAKMCSCCGPAAGAPEDEGKLDNEMPPPLVVGVPSTGQHGFSGGRGLCGSKKGRINHSAFSHGKNGSSLAAAAAFPKDGVAPGASELTPLMAKGSVGANRHFITTVFGLLQGLCCPSCMMGVGIAGQVAASHKHWLSMCIFLAVFVFVSAGLNGVIAMGWMQMMQSSFFTAFVTPRTVYRGSCYVTILLGIFWITANSAGWLEVIDFTDKVSGTIVGDS